MVPEFSQLLPSPLAGEGRVRAAPQTRRSARQEPRPPDARTSDFLIRSSSLRRCSSSASLRVFSACLVSICSSLALLLGFQLRLLRLVFFCSISLSSCSLSLRSWVMSCRPADLAFEASHLTLDPLLLGFALLRWPLLASAERRPRRADLPASPAKPGRGLPPSKRRTNRARAIDRSRNLSYRGCRRKPLGRRVSTDGRR